MKIFKSKINMNFFDTAFTPECCIDALLDRAIDKGLYLHGLNGVPFAKAIDKEIKSEEDIWIIYKLFPDRDMKAIKNLNKNLKISLSGYAKIKNNRIADLE